MITVDDVTGAWMVLKLSGCKMPADAQSKALMASMHLQYANVDRDTWVAVMQGFADKKKFPTFFDIDEAIRNHNRPRQEKPQAVYRQTQTEEKPIDRAANQKRMKELIAQLGSRKLDRVAPSAEIIAHAKHLFPDVDNEWIDRNQSAIWYHKVCEKECENCLAIREMCVYGGHRQFLKINPNTGYAEIFADAELCEKVAGQVRRENDNKERSKNEY